MRDVDGECRLEKIIKASPLNYHLRYDMILRRYNGRRLYNFLKVASFIKSSKTLFEIEFSVVKADKPSGLIPSEMYAHDVTYNTCSFRSRGKKENAWASTPVKGFPLSSSSARAGVFWSNPPRMYVMRLPDIDLQQLLSATIRSC
jgi:hypothetical protein